MCVVDKPKIAQATLFQHRYRRQAEVFTALEDIGEVISKFKHNMTAAYLQEVQITEARSRKKLALAEQLQKGHFYTQKSIRMKA